MKRDIKTAIWLPYTAMMESKILTWLYPVHMDHERPSAKVV